MISNALRFELKALFFALFILIADSFFFGCKKDFVPDPIVPPIDTTSMGKDTLEPLLDSLIGTHAGICHEFKRWNQVISLGHDTILTSDTIYPGSLEIVRKDTDLVEVFGCVGSYYPFSLPINSKERVFYILQNKDGGLSSNAIFEITINLDDRTIITKRAVYHGFSPNLEQSDGMYHF